MASSEIFLYLTNGFVTIDHSPTDTCEGVCSLVCRRLKIQPYVELLFGLRVTGSKNFVAPCQPLVARQKYEFRIRYKLPDVTKIKELDKELFKYYFSQVKHDLLENKISHLQYDEHSQKKIMGLVLTDMYLEMVQNKVSKQDLMGHYKRYVPKVIIKNHVLHFVKRAIKKELDTIEKFDHDPFYIIQSYISEISNIAPDYLTEEYIANSPYLQEGDQAATRTGWCPVTLRISPYHSEKPGLRVHYAYKNMWKSFSIESMSGIETMDLEVRIITQDERDKYLLKFKDRESLESFVSCLSGYYRLMAKWSINLCGNLPSPSLGRLEAMRCHGPIGKEFAYKKIEANRNESGAFLVRECEENYDVYYLDMVWKKDEFRTFKLVFRKNKFHLLYNDTETPFDTLVDAAKSIPVPSGKHFVLQPSDYDKPTKLLLCRYVVEKVELEVVKEGDEIRKGKTLLIDSSRELVLDQASERECEGGVLTRMNGYLIVNEKSKIKVMLNVLKPDKKHNLETFMHLAHKWSRLNSPNLMKMYGFTLYQPIAMVMESSGLGPLNEYFRQVAVLPLSCLISIAYSLLRAIIYLQNESIVHNRIRCSSLYVVSQNDTDVYVRLGDPGFQTTLTYKDIPWIPQEHHNSLELSRFDMKADIWACATTMWEIFSQGDSPMSCLKCFQLQKPPKPPKPECCPKEMYDIMCQGWLDIDSRFKPQSIVQQLHIIQQQEAHVYHDIPHRSRPLLSDQGSLSSGLSRETEHLDLNGDISGTSTGGSTSSISSDRQSMEQSQGKDLRPSHWPGRNQRERQFEVVRHGKIGCGNYGAVYRGEILDRDDCTKVVDVAIKVIDISQSSNGWDEFENECKIMKQLRHPNIVQILDFNMDNLKFVEIVMEYVENNSLNWYLTTKDITKMGTLKLLNFAKDIANGMKYLQSKMIVHRDLAARNVLVDKKERLKISDFGLARCVSIDGYYICRDLDKKVPIAWWAPETLSQSIYTVHSDIWSYGVTLYEIFSGGKEPCLEPDKTLSTESLLEALDKGKRLPLPPECPINIYEKLMAPCWAQKKTMRPTFVTILDTINKLITEFGQEV
ncbi:tyrosine-protein kinase hopscotch [Phlebotomus argentipes]|uniref:tyrosine-protein kinase hopscotch n=1 Tax=Phlebotomus argentipes TaxID=94469 RepID=UPI00289372D6|nr:tyrosine-protein kinase hopscotch [Phlebotomus argentipes]XP_059614534.1 tyrosine-protein kinase hopscotch [Phlebotomus argentipes]